MATQDQTEATQQHESDARHDARPPHGGLLVARRLKAHGVSNGMSAIASAHKNNSPIVVLGGRAPQLRWGQGSLQEIDHVPFVAPITKSARTATATADIPVLLDEAIATALEAPTGPTFMDLPLDVVFMEADDPATPAVAPDPAALPPADPAEVERVAA